MNSLTEKAKKIRCLICDVDGVLSNGLIYLDNFSNEFKAFHVQDGFGLKLLMSADIEVAVITTSQTALIDHRMQQLGIVHYYKGQIEKQSAYEQLKKDLGLNDEDIAYIGDDLPDLPLIRKVGLGVAVGNAVAMVKEFAAYTTQATGGNGGVRELCDLILNAQGKMDSALTKYYKS